MKTAVSTRRVLIADDVPALRVLLKQTLERTGEFEVVAEAGNGAEAIVEAALHKPDVVVLDLSMPVLDGLEALPSILIAAPGVKVVVVSGFGEGRMEREVLDAGAAAYVEKGDILAVPDVIRRVLG